MKKRFFAFMLALILALGTCLTVLATESTTTDNQVSVEWIYNEKGQCTWEVRSSLVDGVTNYYFKLVKGCYANNEEDTVYYSYMEDWIVSSTSNQDYVSVNVSKDIINSGTYQVEVYECYQVSNSWGTSWSTGDCLGTSEVATYTRPEKALGTVYGTIGEDRILRFDAVENADYYIVDICCQRGFGGQEDIFEVYAQESSAKTIEIDINELVHSYATNEGEIWLCALIWAKNNDVNEYAPGYGYDPFDSNVAKHYIRMTDDELTEFMKIYSMAEDYDFIVNSLTTETLQKLLNTSTETRDELKTVEEQYAKENSITVSTKVEQNASTLVDETKITMLGTALNVEEANTNAELVVQIPEKKVDVPTNYINVVQLDISLFIGEKNVTELNVPITITMPIPTGVEAKNIAILHYHNDTTTPTVITPTINADGTITFTVSGFSTFVFTNTVASTSNGTNNTTTNTTTNATTTNGTAPKTGDSTSVYFPIVMLFMAFATIVVCSKRRNFIK